VITWSLGCGLEVAADALDVSRRISVSIVSARVAGVPRPCSFMASRSSSSSMSLPAVSIAERSVASV